MISMPTQTKDYKGRAELSDNRNSTLLDFSRAENKLKQSCIAEWNLLLDYNNNRFIAEVTNDSLPVEKFIFYLKQDHAFLKEFCSFLLRLRDAVGNPSLKTWLAGLHQRTGIL